MVTRQFPGFVADTGILLSGNYHMGKSCYQAILGHTRPVNLHTPRSRVNCCGLSNDTRRRPCWLAAARAMTSTTSVSPESSRFWLTRYRRLSQAIASGACRGSITTRPGRPGPAGGSAPTRPGQLLNWSWHRRWNAAASRARSSASRFSRRTRSGSSATSGARLNTWEARANSLSNSRFTLLPAFLPAVRLSAEPFGWR